MLQSYEKERAIFGLSASEKFKEMTIIYNGDIPSLQLVERWTKHLQAGKMGVFDEPHTGRKLKIINSKSIGRVKKLIEKDSRYTCYGIAATTSFLSSVVQIISRLHLRMRTICARWIPLEQKQCPLKSAKELFKSCRNCDPKRIHEVVIIV